MILKVSEIMFHLFLTVFPFEHLKRRVLQYSMLALIARPHRTNPVLPDAIFSMCVKVIMSFIIYLVLNMEFTESDPVYT